VFAKSTCKAADGTEFTTTFKQGHPNDKDECALSLEGKIKATMLGSNIDCTIKNNGSATCEMKCNPKDYTGLKGFNSVVAATVWSVPSTNPSEIKLGFDFGNEKTKLKATTNICKKFFIDSTFSYLCCKKFLVGTSSNFCFSPDRW